MEIRTVTKEEFKKLNNGNTVSCRIVRHLTEVKPIWIGDSKVGYMMNFDNRGSIAVGFNGAIIKFRVNGTISSKNHNRSSGHWKDNIYAKSVTFERLVMIAHAVYTNRIPVKIEKLDVNVMDASGNYNTAKRFKIRQNFNPENLEWTLREYNRAHFETIKQLYRIFNKVYRVSANDLAFYELCQLGNKAEIEDYIIKNNIQVA